MGGWMNVFSEESNIFFSGFSGEEHSLSTRKAKIFNGCNSRTKRSEDSEGSYSDFGRIVKSWVLLSEAMKTRTS